MAVKILSVHQVANTDEIKVVGTVDDGPEIKVRGWFSAMTNHFPASAFEADGRHKAGVTGRSMTRPEKLAYARGLIAAAAPAPVSADTDLNLAD